MTELQRRHPDRLLNFCVRIDELAFSSCATLEQEFAKMITDPDGLQMSVPQRRKKWSAIQVAMNRWLIGNEPWADDHEQWRAGLNGFITNLRTLADACNSRMGQATDPIGFRPPSR